MTETPMLTSIVLFLVAFGGMEGVAVVAHKYLMHGSMWGWHESHHRPRTGPFEKNDLFVVCFSLPAITLIWLGTNGAPFNAPYALPLGLGLTAYGLAYFLAHDVLVHGRLGIHLRPKRGYLRRLVEAHWLHHSVQGKAGCVSFGFLYAPPVERLQAQLAAARPVAASGRSIFYQ